MNIAKFSVTRPVAVTMRIAALALLGIVCLMRLPMDLLPKVEIPTVAVSVSWPNTGPEEMETQISRPLEAAVATVPGLKRVTSSSSQGNSFVRVEFNYGVNIDSAANDVSQAVQRAKRGFPNDDRISEPTVFKFDPNSLPIIVFGVTGDQDLIKMRDIMTNQISPILESAGGVAQVNIGGGQDRAIMVDVQPAKLEALGISVAQISQRIEQENISLPAGISRQSNTEFSIRAVNYFKTLDDLRKVPLKRVNGQLVTLDQVATVRDASQDVRSYVRMDGKNAILLTITKQSDANTVVTADNVKNAIKDVQKRYPDYKFRVIYDQAQFITASIADLQETAVIGGILAILIITFFLRSLRSTFVVALSIPISIISTFSLIYFCGFTINTISLSGLALASGLIVDDAIVVLENIHRHIERDRKRSAEAAVTGTQEILSAVFSSTFTVMIVFLPLLLIKGQAGQTFTQFALVVVFSLAISLLDATTAVPMLASRMIKESEVIEEYHPELRAQLGHKTGPLTRIFDKFGEWFRALDLSYEHGLKYALKHRFMIVGTGFAAIVFAWLLWPQIGQEQIPQTDTGDVTVRIRLKNATAVAITDAAMKKAEKILTDDPDVESYIAGSGTGVGVRGGGNGGRSNEGSAQVHLKANRTSKTEDVVKRLQKEFNAIPGVNAQVSPYDVVANILGGNNTGLSVDIFGQDLGTLTSVADSVKEALSDIPGLENVDTQQQDANPELQWTVDRAKAQTLGVSTTDISSTLNASTSGQLSSYFQENGFQYPIYVQVPENLRTTPEQLKELPVAGTEGRASSVKLGQVASAVEGLGPNQISRINRQRNLTVGGRVSDRPQSEVMKDMTAALAKVQFPQGYYWKYGQQIQQQDEDYSGLGLAVGLAIALIYMLLATQFESFIFPLVVLTSVPLCSIGMVLALFLTNRSFGLTAFIGLLMLVGIVVKNGILLVDYTNQLRERGVPRDEAIFTAGPTRLRPILMTTLAAILGMLPLAIGIGSGSEMYAPLATVVIGGLATSTMLTLFIVPVVYTIFDDLIRKFTKTDRDLARAQKVDPSVESAEKVPASAFMAPEND
ncbi:efflux RND transporter permease subunit [soil metagenome]